MSMLRLAVLGSTRGTNLLHVIAAIEQQRLSAEIAVVLSDKRDAIILARAKEHHIPAYYVDSSDCSREAYDQRMTDTLLAHQVECILLVGYMRILSASFVEQWRHNILNVHPSLLPDFAGGMDRQVHQAVLDAKKQESGCTVHRVTEVVDAGPILIQKKCPVFVHDTVETLRERVQALEGPALIEAIQTIKREKDDSKKHPTRVDFCI